MKILFLSPYVPLPPTFGGAIRIYNLLKGLSKNNEVTLLTFGTNDKRGLLDDHTGFLYKDYHLVKPTWSWKFRRIAQLYALFSPNSFYSLFSKSSEMQKELDKILNEQDFDVVQIEFPLTANFIFNTNVPKVLDEHNIEYNNFKRMYEKASSPLIKLHYLSEYKKTYKEEISVLKKMNAVLTVSGNDKAQIEPELKDKPLYVVPNGVDTSYFKPSSNKVEKYSIVFTGIMAYMPNHDGIIYFLNKIFPLILKEIPQAKIYIVGSRPPKSLLKRASENVIVTGFVPDVRTYVWNAALYVVPLRMGSGTRLKILEALAMKKPVISTTIGCEGIDVINNESILIEDDPKNFAAKAVWILKNPERGNKIVNEGYKLIQNKYDWNTINQRLEEILQISALEKAETWGRKKLIERTS